MDAVSKVRQTARTRWLMKLLRSPRWPLVATLLLVTIAGLLGGCGALGGAQNTFAPDGEVANEQRDMFILVLIPAIIILFLVGGALLYIVVRFRHRPDQPLPRQIHGNSRLEVAWTIVPLLLLIGLAVPTLKGIVDLGRAPHKDALHIKVIAFRFAWQFEYEDAEFKDPSGQALTSATELHIPVGREVGVVLNSQDVIHSFWVPKLAGKLDVIPGRNNEMWFNASEVGTYSGQCAELCGIGHANMRFRVIAQTQNDFEAWVKQQMSPQANAGGGQ